MLHSIWHLFITEEYNNRPIAESQDNEQDTNDDEWRIQQYPARPRITNPIRPLLLAKEKLSNAPNTTTWGLKTLNPVSRLSLILSPLSISNPPVSTLELDLKLNWILNNSIQSNSQKRVSAPCWYRSRCDFTAEDKRANAYILANVNTSTLMASIRTARGRKREFTERTRRVTATAENM